MQVFLEFAGYPNLVTIPPYKVFTQKLLTVEGKHCRTSPYGILETLAWRERRMNSEWAVTKSLQVFTLETYLLGPTIIIQIANHVKKVQNDYVVKFESLIPDICIKRLDCLS